MYFEIEKKFEIDKINAPIVLVGWPGIALVGQLAINSIKDSIKADLFLNIESFDFPPKSSVENGVLELPSAQLYYKSRDTNDLFILTANFQPQTSKGVFEFSRQFCNKMDEILGRDKIKMYISAGALVTDEINELPFVHVCGTDKDLVETFLKLENTKTMDGGIIAGANGILPAWAGSKGHAPGICLLSETMPLPMMNLDPRASKALVTILMDYFKIEMTFDELDKKIEEMETMFTSFRKQADQIMRGGSENDNPDSYFR